MGGWGLGYMIIIIIITTTTTTINNIIVVTIIIIIIILTIDIVLVVIVIMMLIMMTDGESGCGDISTISSSNRSITVAAAPLLSSLPSPISSSLSSFYACHFKKHCYVNNNNGPLTISTCTRKCEDGHNVRLFSIISLQYHVEYLLVFWFDHYTAISG